MRAVVCIDPAGPGTPPDSASLSGRLRRLSGVQPELMVGDLPARLDNLEQLLRSATGPVTLVDGRFVGHDSVLVDVMGDPRGGSAVLVGGQGDTWPVRVVQGVLVSAGSPHHEVSDPSADRGSGAGLVLRVGAEDLSAAADAVAAVRQAAVQDGWTDDALLPLVTVGLVRHQLRVVAVPAGPFVAATSSDPQERQLLADRVRAVDEHGVRLRGAARPRDGFYSTMVVRRLSRRFTALALRVGLTPNAVTLVALLVAAVAAGCFAVGTWPWLLAGAVLLQLSLVIDCVDGEVARYTRRHTALGAWLDASSDRVKEFGIYAALAVGAARQGDDLWLLAIATMALQVTRHFVDFGFAVRQDERVHRVTTPPAAPFARRADVVADPGASAGTSAGRAAASLSDRTNEVPWLVWAKRVVIMPIGERWLVISVVTVLWGPRAALGALLALGAVAACYTTAGRLLRTLRGSAASAEGRTRLTAMADLLPGDGVAVGRLTGLPLGWLLPAAARAGEYGLLLLLAALPSTPAAVAPWVFGYLFVLTVWHYDVVYRVRQLGRGPSRWARLVTAGAVPRSAAVLAVALTAPPLLAPLLAVVALFVLTATVLDSLAAWRRWERSAHPTASLPPFRVEVPA